MRVCKLKANKLKLPNIKIKIFSNVPSIYLYGTKNKFRNWFINALWDKNKLKFKKCTHTFAKICIEATWYNHTLKWWSGICHCQRFGGLYCSLKYFCENNNKKFQKLMIITCSLHRLSIIMLYSIEISVIQQECTNGLLLIDTIM